MSEKAARKPKSTFLDVMQFALMWMVAAFLVGLMYFAVDDSPKGETSLMLPFLKITSSVMSFPTEELVPANFGLRGYLGGLFLTGIVWAYLLIGAHRLLKRYVGKQTS
jgi:hypothetical protein